jgi:sugar phosphate isomerase/epimerase
MKIGFNTDGLGFQPFEQMLKTITSLGVKKLELPMGNWSSAPHVDLDALVSSKDKRDEYMGKVSSMKMWCGRPISLQKRGA